MIVKQLTVKSLNSKFILIFKPSALLWNITYVVCLSVCVIRIRVTVTEMAINGNKSNL